jgi:hypothetical protein
VATFNNMAGALMSIGRLADAVRCCEAALVRYVEEGALGGAALVRCNLAAC